MHKQCCMIVRIPWMKFEEHRHVLKYATSFFCFFLRMLWANSFSVIDLIVQFVIIIFLGYWTYRNYKSDSVDAIQAFRVRLNLLNLSFENLYNTG